MKLEDLETKLGIANLGEEEKLALVKDIQANLPALKAEQRTLEAKTQANLVVEAIKKIKEGLEARFDELNGIVDVKVRDITSGKDGKDGKDGKNGVDGKDGKDGISITGPKGADGKDGEDGVGVQDAHIDFDGSLIITLTTGKEINVGEVVPMDVAEKIKVIGNGGGTSQSVLDAIAALTTATTTSAAITGGTINGATVGATTPAAGTFTTLTAQTEVLKGTGQNYLRYSEQFQNGVWTSFGTVTVTADTQVAPDGNTTADTLAFSSSSGLYQIFTGIGLTTYTFSIYLKAASATSVSVVINTNLSDPVTVVASVTTSWQRFTVSKTTSSGTSSVTAQLQTGGSSSTVYAWGAQVELGSGANTYVPTTTTAVYGTPTLSFSGVAGLGLQSDGSLYVSPAGTGALQAQATTSTATGGNARGVSAVDWQLGRDTAAKVASGAYSVITGGYGNTATNQYSAVLSGGVNSNGSFQGVISGGVNNTASSSWSVISGGASNTANGNYNFVGGGYTNSGTASAAVTTQSGTMNGTTAVTLSGSNGSIKVGQYISGTSIANDTYVAAISGTSLTLSKNASGSSTSTLSFYTPHGVVVGGGNNQATGSYSFIGGGGDAGTAANRNVASGDWSFVGGGAKNTASGLGSVVCGGGIFSAGSYFANTASNLGAFVGGGTNNTASGQFSTISGGLSNLTSGLASFIGGGDSSTASGIYSSVLSGQRATTRAISGNTIFGSGAPISLSVGAGQAGLLILNRQTTDATATVLTSDTTTAGTTNQVILPNNSAYYFRGTVVAGVTGGGNTKGWYIEGVIKRGSGVGTTALVGTPTVMSSYADVGAATWAITATADTTNGGLAITFTGQAATTIRCVAKIETTEMTY